VGVLSTKAGLESVPEGLGDAATSTTAAGTRLAGCCLIAGPLPMLALPGLPWQELVTWHVRMLLEHLLLEHLPERRGLSLGLSRRHLRRVAVNNAKRYMLGRCDGSFR
jgi:hypothetical protein